MGATADETGVKQPSEKRMFTMDFSAKMNSNETIKSSPAPAVTSIKTCGTASDLDITDLTISGQIMTMLIAGGTSGVRYRVEVILTTSLDYILEGDGILKVSDV